MLLRKRCNFLMPDPCLLKEEGKNLPEQQLGKGDEALGGNMARTLPDGTLLCPLPCPHLRLRCR